MRAIVQQRYGPPDQVLRLAEIDPPRPSDAEVLIRVHAAGVNALDWHFVMGSPYVARLGMGRGRPKVRVRGVDVAGRVEAVGKAVRSFRPGDDVVGWCAGAFAELAADAEDHFVAMPSSMSFEEAAALPVAACTALQGLRDHGHLQPGQQVLIHGAGGGVGTFAVQIAKALGAQVTAVSRHVELMKELGADRAIDYTKEDFTTRSDRYDLIFDNGGTHPISAVRRVLKPGGVLVYNSGASMARIATAMLLSRMSRNVATFLAGVTQADLLALKEMIDAGKLRSVIDRSFRLEDTAQAVSYVATGRARGKVVVTVP